MFDVEVWIVVVVFCVFCLGVVWILLSVGVVFFVIDIVVRLVRYFFIICWFFFVCNVVKKYLLIVKNFKEYVDYC